MYSILRYVRIVVSAVFALLLTWSIVDTGFGITPFGLWLLKTQIVPAILSSAVAWLVLWVLVTLTFGRVYCSTVCPLGFLQDVAGRLGRTLGRGAQRRYSYSPPVYALRFLVPLVVAACLFLGITVVVEATDPYSLYRRIVLAAVRPAAIGLSGLAFAALVFVLVVAFAWRKGRLLCNTVCPAGGLLGLLGRQPVYRVDINTDKCIHCGKCEDRCKASCIDLRDCVVDSSRCVMCMDCTAVCPNDAITVRRGKHQLSIPMMQRTASSMAVGKSQPSSAMSIKSNSCK